MFPLSGISLSTCIAFIAFYNRRSVEQGRDERTTGENDMRMRRHKCSLRPDNVPHYLLLLLVVLVIVASFPLSALAVLSSDGRSQRMGDSGLRWIPEEIPKESRVQSVRALMLSEGNSIVLQGKVLGIVSVLEGPLIVSYATILVSQVAVGPDSLRGGEITLKYIGGEVNGVILWLSDQPHFAVGESVQVEVRQEGDIYVALSPETTLETPYLATAAGYLLWWWMPGTGWQKSSTRPGADWYGPAKWSGGGFDYWINTANIPSDVSSPSFITYATASFQTWEDDAGSSVDLTYRGTTTVTSWGQDGVNWVGWGLIGGGTIAATRVLEWAVYTPGDYGSLRYTEADIMFDNSKSWSAQSSGVAGRYDVQNIGTHEAGHTIGLADMYDAEDSEQTMYGYASTGETKKRTLEWGDRAGVAALYPSTGYTVTFKTNPTSWSGSAGSITVDGSSTYTNGQTGSYTSTHNILVNVPSGYQFVWVSGNRNPPQSDPTGVYVPNIGSPSTSMDVNGNGWLKATFAAVITFHTNTGTGSISYGSQPYTDGQTRAEGNLLPDYGNTVTITANPPSGQPFVSWTVSGMLSVANPSSQSTTLTVNGPGTLTANFQAGYTVTFKTNPTSWAGSPGCFTVDGSGPCYTDGQTASLTGGHTVSVSVPSGYQFVWVAGNRNPPQSDPTGVYVPNISANPTSFDVNGNGWLKATFAAVITFHTNTGTGSISYGSQPYTDGQTRAEANLLPDYGNTVTITANPSGSQFSSWSVSGMLTVDSTSSQTTTLHVNGPGTLTANFNLNPPAAPVLVSPGDGASGVSLTPTLSWQSVATADGYQVGVYDVASGSWVLVVWVTGTSYPVPSGNLVSGHVYMWAVWAHNAAGFGSPSSRLFST